MCFRIIFPFTKQPSYTKVWHEGTTKANPLTTTLEFLGDAILDAIVGDIVYEHFPGKREGFLTNTRSKIVQRETLNKLANDLGITRLILSSGHSQSHNSYLGGNAFEALVGALYLDHGYTACMKFMKKQILGELINIDKVAYKEVNFKSKLIEWTQKHKICLEFKPLSFGKDKEGSPTFSFQVVLEGIACGEGSGYSKKESQQEAAKVTLQYIRKNTKFADKIFKAKQKRIALEQPEDLSVIETTEDNVSVLPLKDDADDESNTFTQHRKEKIAFLVWWQMRKKTLLLKQKQRLSNNNSYIKQCKIALSIYNKNIK